VLRDDTGRAVRIMAMISDRTANKLAARELHPAESSAEKGKPMLPKKAAVKKAAKKAPAAPAVTQAAG